jgi:hypothetical protein
MFRNRSFQVKLVKDQRDSGEPITPNDPVGSILIAQSYADLVVSTSTDLAKIAATLIVVKTGCDLIRIAANAIAK